MRATAAHTTAAGSASSRCRCAKEPLVARERALCRGAALRVGRHPIHVLTAPIIETYIALKYHPKRDLLTHVEIQRFVQAAAHLKLALKHQPRPESVTIVSLARCYQELGKLEEAMEVCVCVCVRARVRASALRAATRNSASSRSISVSPYEHVYRCRIQLIHTHAHVQHYDAALRGDGPKAYAFFSRGHCRLLLGDEHGAASDFAQVRARARTPTHTDAHACSHKHAHTHACAHTHTRTSTCR